MRKIFARAATFAVVFACALHGAEDAGNMLKVPPVGDRPVGDATNPADAVAAKTEPSPTASPTAEPEGGPTPANETAPDAAAEGADEGIVPEPFPVSRYASLWENSPFQIESIAPPQQSEGLAQRFVLGGILRENGEPVVWVRERATQQSYKVARNATNSVGLSLVEISESKERQSEATATIRLGAELGVIKFDTAAAGPVPGMGMAPPMPRPAIPPPIRPPQQVPGMNAGQQANAQPVRTPGISPQQPGVNPAIAQPGVVPPVPGPGIPAEGQVQVPGQEQMPPPRVIRRRAIVPAAPSAP